MKKIIILILVALAACSSFDIQTNDIEFKKKYIEPFIAQAESYGTWISYAPVEIIYVDKLEYNGDDLAGYSDVRNKVIYFNTSHEMWNSEGKKALVYHELAHYFINKVHIDEECSCDVPFSIMSMWSKQASPEQYEYWVSGQWKEMEEYYMKELFLGSNVWDEYPGHEDIISHEIQSPCK